MLGRRRKRRRDGDGEEEWGRRSGMVRERRREEEGGGRWEEEEGGGRREEGEEGAGLTFSDAVPFIKAILEGFLPVLIIFLFFMFLPKIITTIIMKLDKPRTEFVVQRMLGNRLFSFRVGGKQKNKKRGAAFFFRCARLSVWGWGE
jgi:hypothetical protein